MQKFEGIHFYVNVANFNEVVTDEEMKSDKVNHRNEENGAFIIAYGC